MNKINAIGIATLALAALAGSAAAQVSLGASYSQNFDGLTGGTWTNNSTLSGWSLFASGTFGYGLGSGFSTAGQFYSIGTTFASTDRALGSLGSNGSGNQASSVVLTRSASLRPVTGLTIAYNGEQWRNGGNTTAQVLSFGYQVFSTAPTTTAQLGPAATGYTGVSSLDFTSQVNTGTAAAVDGNVAGRSARSGSISGLSLSSTNFLALRWLDLNDSGNDHQLSIDDLTVTVASVDNALPTASNFSATINLGDQPYTLDLLSLISDTDIAAAWGESFTYDGTGDAGFSRTGSSLTLSGVGNGTYTYLFTATDSLGASTSLTTVSITVVPTPGAAALLGTGALLMARRRRA